MDVNKNGMIDVNQIKKAVMMEVKLENLYTGQDHWWFTLVTLSHARLSYT